MTQRNKHLQMVRDFHEAFKYEQDLNQLTPKLALARPSYISEEVGEWLSSLAAGNKVMTLDALCDLPYFALGTIAILGGEVVPLAACVLSGVPASSNELMAYHYNLLTALVEKPTPKEVGYLEEIIVDQCSEVYWNCMQEAEVGLNADFDGAFTEVHASNMSKLGGDGQPIYDEAGKIRKGPGYFEPQLLQFFR